MLAAAPHVAISSMEITAESTLGDGHFATTYRSCDVGEWAQRLGRRRDRATSAHGLAPRRRRPVADRARATERGRLARGHRRRCGCRSLADLGLRHLERAHVAAAVVEHEPDARLTGPLHDDCVELDRARRRRVPDPGVRVGAQNLVGRRADGDAVIGHSPRANRGAISRLPGPEPPNVAAPTSGGRSEPTVGRGDASSQPWWICPIRPRVRIAIRVRPRRSPSTPCSVEPASSSPAEPCPPPAGSRRQRRALRQQQAERVGTPPGW